MEVGASPHNSDVLEKVQMWFKDRGLREKLNWFEKLPLFGKKVVVTRARSQASSLAAKLRSLGADVIEFPTIEVRDADDYTDLDHAIANLATYDWLAFTSPVGVRFSSSSGRPASTARRSPTEACRRTAPVPAISP